MRFRPGPVQADADVKNPQLGKGIGQGIIQRSAMGEELKSEPEVRSDLVSDLASI